MDAAYISATVGAPLAAALAHVASLRPDDAVACLGRTLLAAADVMAAADEDAAAARGAAVRGERMGGREGTGRGACACR
jgi:hypothetical protein